MAELGDACQVGRALVQSRLRLPIELGVECSAIQYVCIGRIDRRLHSIADFFDESRVDAMSRDDRKHRRPGRGLGLGRMVLTCRDPWRES